MTVRRGDGSEWWVVVIYADGEVDVVGCRTYLQARGVFDSAAAEVASGGVWRAEIFDVFGRCVASPDHGVIVMDAPRRAGRYLPVCDPLSSVVEYIPWPGSRGAVAPGSAERPTD